MNRFALMWPDSDLALLGALTLSAFLAATLLPGGSEVALAGLLALRPDLSLPALTLATLGNTAGGMSSYALGRLLPRKEASPGSSSYAATAAPSCCCRGCHCSATPCALPQAFCA